jgi:hypothetical protein
MSGLHIDRSINIHMGSDAINLHRKAVLHMKEARFYPRNHGGHVIKKIWTICSYDMAISAPRTLPSAVPLAMALFFRPETFISPLENKRSNII